MDNQQEIIKLNKYVSEQINNRYAMFDRQTSRQSNIVMDNYCPKMIKNSLLGRTVEPAPATAVVI